MADKSILLAIADLQASVEITQALGAGWEATSVSGEGDALAQLEGRSFNALLADFNLGSPDGSELLNRALEKRPETVRFLLAYEADLALVAAKVVEPYQILPKPIEWASLKNRIENGVAPEDSRSNQRASEQGGGASAVPEPPPVYAEALNALTTLGTSNADIGEIISRDEALTTELLGLTHSAYLGLPGNITDPAEAVESLGLETVKAVVMALQFLSQHRKLEPGYLSFEQIWRHSTNVARLARDLVLFETKDMALASEALMAGLLHDLGKVVLVTNFGDLYGRVHSLGRKQPVPIWEIEKEIFGANHGEIGGCLIGMWDLPRSVVEAAALHHDPPLGEHDHLDALTAVHIANVFEHERRANAEGYIAPIISTPLLNELGLLERLPIWRAAIAKRSFANLEPRLESAEKNQRGAIPPVPAAAPPPRSGNQLSAPAAPTRTATLGETATHGGQQPAVLGLGNRQMRWVYAGVAATLLIVLVFWLGRQPAPVYARTPAPVQAPVVVSSTPRPEPAAAPAPAPDTTTTAAATAAATETPEEFWTTNFTTVPEPASSRPEPHPGQPPVAPPAAVATVPAPSVSAKPQPDFRVSGVIYTKARPSAIVNGEAVCVGDYINGALVIGIGRTNVILGINGQRKSYIVR
jgi:HD-like signal output (HDOD) protein